MFRILYCYRTNLPIKCIHWNVYKNKPYSTKGINMTEFIKINAYIYSFDIRVKITNFWIYKNQSIFYIHNEARRRDALRHQNKYVNLRRIRINTGGVCLRAALHLAMCAVGGGEVVMRWHVRRCRCRRYMPQIFIHNYTERFIYVASFHTYAHHMC